MSQPDADVRALRDALVPAVRRDLAGRRRRRSRRVTIPLAVCATAVAGTGVAAATGVIFADPKVPDVPAAQEWMYYSHDPTSPERTGGPVIMRPRPEAVARTNRAMEGALRERGITARCGEDKAHPLACYLPSGDQVPGTVQAEAEASLDGPDVLGWPGNSEVRPLSDAEARQWLCDNADQGSAEDRAAAAC